MAFSLTAMSPMTLEMLLVLRLLFPSQTPKPHYVSYAIDLDGRGWRVEIGDGPWMDGHGQQRNLNYFFAALIKPFADLSRRTNSASAAALLWCVRAPFTITTELPDWMSSHGKWRETKQQLI